MDNDKIIAVCENCDSEIYRNEMYVFDLKGVLLCMDCATSISEEKKESKNG